MPRFGIVAALEREVALFTRNCRVAERVHDGRTFRFFERGETVLVCGGIGVQAARRATEALIALYRPETVQSVGYAGALIPALKVGALVRPERIVDAGDGSSVEIGEGRGVLVTSRAVAAAEQKHKLAAGYRAEAVDMEAAAVARGAEARGIRFTALKVISDEYGFDMPPTERFVTSSGQFQAGRFALFAVFHPWFWGSVLALARNSRTATQKLCEALEEEFQSRPRKAAPSV
jgi:adenosylhomocysteine nucleosidase